MPSWLYIAGSNAPWTPADLSPTLWLRADLGITKDGSDLVSTWADQSGNANDYTASGGTRPTWMASTLNGQNGITFNGSKVMDGPGSAMISPSSPMELIMIYRLTTGPVGFPTLAEFAADSVNNSPNLFYSNNAGYMDMSFGAQTGGFRTGRARCLVTGINDYHYHRFSYDGTGSEIEIYENAVLQTNGAQPDTGSVFGANSLGAFQGGVGSGQWVITEVILVNNTLSAGDVLSLNTYINTRYGL